ncbi:MAG: ABC transporter permease [Gemmatimonadaceae bacterium]
MSDDGRHNAHSDRQKRAFRIESGAQRVQRDVDEEMEFHLAMRTQKLAKSGLSPQAAREEALKQFGDFTTVRTECIAINREHHRAMNRVNRLQDLKQDIVYGIRSLGNNKSFAAITVLILALGIGANTAMFSLIDVMILRSLPVPHAEQLITIGNPDRVGSVSQGAEQANLFSFPMYTELRDAAKTLSGVYATGRAGRLDVRVGGDSVKSSEPEHPSSRFVSGNYFSVLQQQPAAGRMFSAQEDRISGDAPVVVIGYSYWQSRFGGLPSVIGRTLSINGTPFTIIGVGAQNFSGDLVDRVIDVFIPLTMQPFVNLNTEWLKDRKTCWLQVMGRRKDTASLEQVRAEASTIVKRSLIEHAKASDVAGIEKDLREEPLLVESGAHGFSLYRTTYAKSLYTLMAAVALVLLVVCANVANLLLARATARSREMSVRMALGASRLRLVQQLLTESLIIALAGGALGLVVAMWGSKGLLRLANGQGTGIMLDTSLDSRVLAFSAVVSLFTAALFGLMPALRSTRVELATALRSSGRNVTGAGGKFSAGRLLVVAQVSMSVLLLVGTGMLLRSMQHLDNADVGADRSHVLIADIEAQQLGYKGARLLTLQDDILRRVRQVPGVIDASLSENGIFSGTESHTSMTAEGFVARTEEDSSSAYDDVGVSYFRTAGAKMLEGRDFSELDNETGAKAVIVNAAFAKHFFPGGSAIGRHVTYDSIPRAIVGVVADVNGRDLRTAPERRLYIPVKQIGEPPENFYLLVRTSGDPVKSIAAVRSAVLGADPLIPMRRVNALSALIHDSVSQDRLVARVVTLFGALTLILSALGLYGVMAYATMRRTSEFGLRLALGAVPGSIVRMVLRDALGLTVFGLVIGLPLAFGMSRLLHEQFFGIGTIDVPSLMLAVVVLSGAAALAGYVPAMRASRVAPLDALRSD